MKMKRKKALNMYQYEETLAALRSLRRAVVEPDVSTQTSFVLGRTRKQCFVIYTNIQYNKYKCSLQIVLLIEDVYRVFNCINSDQ